MHERMTVYIQSDLYILVYKLIVIDDRLLMLTLAFPCVVRQGSLILEVWATAELTAGGLTKPMHGAQVEHKVVLGRVRLVAQLAV